MEAIGVRTEDLRVDSEELGSRHAAAHFEEKLRALFAVDVALYDTPARHLSAHMTAYRGRNLRFAALRFSPHSTRSAGSIRPSDSRLLVSLHRSGHVVVEQGGRRSSIEPGQMFVIDPTQEFRITTGEIETLSVYLPRASVAALVPQLCDLTALPIPGNTGSGAVLRAALEAMCASIGSLDDDAGDSISDALPYLLAPALSALLKPDAVGRSRLRQLHKQQIRRFVAEHLGDPALSAAMIAEGVRLSPRHVYELFSCEAESLMKWVWFERLDRCERDLARPQLRMRTIGEIAYAWGFSNVSHFSRAFKQRVGVSPRQYRLDCERREPALCKEDAEESVLLM